MKLSMDEVPTIALEGLTKTQRKAYVIADNKLALNAGWDDELLRIDFSELDSEGFDLDLTGFTSEEMADIIGHVDELDEMPELRSGDREPFQQMTFTLHDEQAEQVKRSLEVAKAMGDFIGSDNENSNGNALARVCEIFMTQHGNC